MVHPGNDQFVSGDKIDRPKEEVAVKALAKGRLPIRRRADDFVFQISKDEYLDLLFEDLELPRLQKTQLNQLMEVKTYRAGYTSNGCQPTSMWCVHCKIRWPVGWRCRPARNASCMSWKIGWPAGSRSQRTFCRNSPAREGDQGAEKDGSTRPFHRHLDLKFNNFVKRPVPPARR